MRARSAAVTARARPALLALAILAAVAPGAQASRRHRSASAKTSGLGRSCKKKSDCRGKTQVCLKENDADGKQVATGFCVLPCAPYDAGTTRVVPGEQPLSPQEYAKRRKAPVPRCPGKYLCRTAGAGVPIDMCVKE